MFTIDAIEQAHDSVKTGADFPKYIGELIQLGVVSFETWVKDSHTVYLGSNNYTQQSLSQYADLTINQVCEKEEFQRYLRMHQEGQTDYYTFCTHCALTGIEKWIMDLQALTCTYYDIQNQIILVEHIHLGAS